MGLKVDQVFASSNVQHMSNARTWLEASTSCGEQGLEDNEDKLKDSGIQIEIEFWIGRAVYSEMTPWIEVLGCTSSTDTGFKLYKVETIGQCQHKCDAEKVFGYTYKALQSICVCFPNGVPTGLNRACENSNDFLIYRYYNGTINDDLIDPGNCVTVCCGNCRETSQRYMMAGRNCFAIDTYIVGRCTPFNEKDQLWGQNYNTSIFYCLQRNKLLLSPSFCTNTTDSSYISGVRAWTNVFRENFVVEKSGLHQNPTMCYKGVLHKIENQTKQLDVYLGNCNDGVKWFICKNTTTHDIQRSTTGKTSTLPPLEVSTLQQSSIRNTFDTKSITVSLQTSTNRKSTEKFTKKDNNPNSYTGVIIGGSIGSFVMLTILAAIFVCRKKSLWIFKEKKKTKDDTEEFSQIPNNNLQNVSAAHVKPTSNQNYGITTNLSSTYAVVNKLTKSDKKFTEKDDTYMDSQDGQYDQLNDIQKRKITMEGNLYDSHEGIRDQYDPTYDSSKLSRSHEVTDVYDHSFLGTHNDGEYAYSSTYRSASTNETEIYDKTV